MRTRDATSAFPTPHSVSIHPRHIPRQHSPLRPASGSVRTRDATSVLPPHTPSVFTLRSHTPSVFPLQSHPPAVFTLPPHLRSRTPRQYPPVRPKSSSVRTRDATSAFPLVSIHPRHICAPTTHPVSPHFFVPLVAACALETPHLRSKIVKETPRQHSRFLPTRSSVRTSPVSMHPSVPKVAGSAPAPPHLSSNHTLRQYSPFRHISIPTQPVSIHPSTTSASPESHHG